MSNKVLLMILDGWGNGDHSKSDVIYSTNPEYINAMTAAYPHAELKTDGENVGLPEGQMDNSEVGHLNIGAGRVVYQDLVKINRACRDNSILENKEVVAAFEYAKQNGVNVHFMGLVSDGGVHSSLDHLFKLCDISKHYGIENTFVHCFMDGRDTDPRSGKGFIAALEEHMAKSTGKIASIIGYSDKMLELYGRYIVRHYQNGQNVAYEIITNTMKFYGYESVEDAAGGNNGK